MLFSFFKGVSGVSGSCRAIGVADNNKIPDDNITSSTFWTGYDATQGRLNGETGWCPSTEKDRDDYIQVDMGAVRSVCAVATQGKKTRSFTESYKLSFSADGVNWITYKECSDDKVEDKYYLIQKKCCNSIDLMHNDVTCPERRYGSGSHPHIQDGGQKC